MKSVVALALVGFLSPAAPVRAQDTYAGRKPEAVIDLGTNEGVRLANGQWRYSDVRIIEVDFKAAGPDGQPSATPNRTYDFTPHAGGADFDDSTWEVIDPTTLDKRRGGGRLSFNWYRIELTVPDKIGLFDPTGSTLVFETSVDDYAEIWVDGELSRAAGQSGGSVVKGWNASNRLVVARNAKPGQKIQLAVFGINGPLSNPPTNYIYIRYARLEFHRAPGGPVALAPQEVNVEVVRLDPAIDAIVPLNAKLFKIAEEVESPPVHGGAPGAQILDVHGNSYAIESGGIRLVSKLGKPLGTIVPSRPPRSLFWGKDGKALYMTAGDGLYRMPLKIEGLRPPELAGR